MADCQNFSSWTVSEARRLGLASEPSALYTRIRRIRAMQSVAKKKHHVVPVRIADEMAERMDRAVSKLRYSSRGEFIRDAIESHLDRVEVRIVETRDVSVDEAVKLMDEYLAENPGAHYVSDMAEYLGLELPIAFRAAGVLREKGMARERHS